MATYVRFEDLIGTTVRNAHGRPIGRIEEVRVEPEGEDYLVKDFLIGPAERIPRLLAFFSQLPTLRALGIPHQRRLRPFPWRWIDLSDPTRPIVSSDQPAEA
jgi:sporulation protein YlmC with PRC-barrel domain